MLYNDPVTLQEAAKNKPLNKLIARLTKNKKDEALVALNDTDDINAKPDPSDPSPGSGSVALDKPTKQD